MARRTWIGAVLCVGIISTVTAPARAAGIVTLDLQLNPAANTWELFASLSNDTRGLASFAVDVVGAGGASVTSSLVQAPRPFDATLNDFKGFRLLRSNGTSGVDVRASQDTVAGDAAVLLLDEGVAAPVRLASGSYLGSAGTLTAQLHPGSLFNVFPSNFVAGGPTAAATSVVPETVAVPEPGMVGMAAAAGMVAMMRRRPKPLHWARAD